MNTPESSSQALLDHLNILRDAGVRYVALDNETTHTETSFGQGEFDSTIAEPGPPVAATLTSATPLPEVSMILPYTEKLLGSGFVEESLPHEMEKKSRNRVSQSAVQ